MANTPPEVFGFTFVHEDEIDAKIELEKQKAAASAAASSKSATALTYQEKLEAVEAIVVPFMQNLMKDPEKVMIRWPNRKEVVERQLNKILSITQK